MAEDNSFLSHFITEEIYLIKDDLVSTSTQEPLVESVAETSTEPVSPSLPKQPVLEDDKPVYIKPLPTEGNNLKHCIIFFEADQPQLEVEKKAFLLKVMASVKRSLDDVLLVNVKEASAEQIEAVLNEFNHRHVLVFNSKKLDSYNNNPLYEVKEDRKKFYMKADDLGEIEATVALKKALWAGLQKMFL
ncbi:hypothetical protein EV198_0851 [Roseivirga ehrenbergii]|nr:hypothetical protein [Roseivirga ehrenbergii]TCL14015.1 hypothetical protein EV198_0851 [Roseivirga ehrenbergii]